MDGQMLYHYNYNTCMLQPLHWVTTIWRHFKIAFNLSMKFNIYDSTWLQWKHHKNAYIYMKKKKKKKKLILIIFLTFEYEVIHFYILFKLQKEALNTPTIALMNKFCPISVLSFLYNVWMVHLCKCLCKYWWT